MVQTEIRMVKGKESEQRIVRSEMGIVRGGESKAMRKECHRCQG